MKSLFYTLAILLMAAPVTAHAEGPIRQRIKERVVERIESKQSSTAETSVFKKITTPGDYYFGITHQGFARKYHVHVPPSYNVIHPPAVVFALHGGGGDMEYMAKDEYYGLISKADKEGFVVVFPNGYSRLSAGKFATWNAGACCGDARDKNVDDVGFIRAIVTHLTREMKIDSGRIFAIGMSNGGMMSYRLACEASDIFKAVASVAGTDNFSACSPSRPVSILHIHAKDDTHVLFNGGAGEGAFRDESKVTDFVSVPNTIQGWVNRDQCSAQPQRVLNVSGAYCDVYNSCAAGTAVKLCVTETGGHSWPGGYKPRGGDPSQAISANDQIWSFFKNLN